MRCGQRREGVAVCNGARAATASGSMRDRRVTAPTGAEPPVLGQPPRAHRTTAPTALAVRGAPFRSPTPPVSPDGRRPAIRQDSPATPQRHPRVALAPASGPRQEFLVPARVRDGDDRRQDRGQTGSGPGVGTVRKDQHVPGGQAGSPHTYAGRLPLLARTPGRRPADTRFSRGGWCETQTAESGSPRDRASHGPPAGVDA